MAWATDVFCDVSHNRNSCVSTALQWRTLDPSAHARLAQTGWSCCRVGDRLVWRATKLRAIEDSRRKISSSFAFHRPLHRRWNPEWAMVWPGFNADQVEWCILARYPRGRQTWKKYPGSVASAAPRASTGMIHVPAQDR